MPRRSFMTQACWERLNAAVGAKSDHPLLYSVAALPEQLAWGASPVDNDTDDLSGYIVAGDRPLRVLIIGEVVQAYLTGSSKNNGSASIRVRPLLTSEGDRLDTIIQGFSTSSAGEQHFLL